MATFDPATHFPHMKPVKSAPSMFLLNGCGTRLYGNRDLDRPTGAYVSTLCVTLLFIPIFALRAYRVAPAERGWYFLGTEPLSLFAKAWNLSLVGAIVVTVLGISLTTYWSTPAYKAGHQMAQARALADKGQLAQAAGIYQGLASAGAEQADNASAALKELIQSKTGGAPLAQAAGAITAASHVSNRSDSLTNAQLVERALELVADKSAADPQGGLALLDAARPLALDTRLIDKARLPLLQSWAAREPTNLDAVIPLASLLEEQHQLDPAKKLLLPVKDKLGDGEGARVLGSIYVQEGAYEDAYALLSPYVKVRLDRLHSAEDAADATADRLAKRELQLLNDEKGPHDFYERYKGASEEQQNAMVHEYVSARLKTNPEFVATQAELAQATEVVPVTLELGIVMLQRAHNLTNADERKKQLESAEKMFLSIRSFAGESEEYRLFLGEVYYWLGKQAEGQKLFDDLLASKGRNSVTLIEIASKLRNVGAEAQARGMAEEAYNKAGNAQERHNAASLRSYMSIDVDDEIAWLNKADYADANVKARLESSLGDKAFETGHDDEAQQHYKASIEAYNAQPRDTGTINDTALAYYRLFQANGDRAALDHCFDLMQQAVNLSPSDAIMVFNAASITKNAAMFDIIGNQIDLRALHQSGDSSMLGYLYHDQAGRQALVTRVKEHPGTARSLAYYEKAMLLSPKQLHVYQGAFDVYSFLRDDAALLDLQNKIKLADPDTSDDLNHFKEYLSGARDSVGLTATNASIKRLEALSAALRPKGGITAAVALDEYAVALLQADVYTQSADPGKILALAQEAHQLAPSGATAGVLITAHLSKAAMELRASEPAFAALVKQYERPVGFSYFVIAVSNEPGPLQPKILNHPDVQKALDLQLELDRAFPDNPSILTWVLLKNTRPAEAEKIAAAIRKDPHRLIMRSVTERVVPTSVSEALESCWLWQVNHQPEKDQASLARMVALGIPVPPQP